MTNIEFAAKAKNIAKNYKTLYVWGAFGAPATPANKKRYAGSANNLKRTPAINAASADTFFFDCSGLIKGILWGWSGNKNVVYGGAVYGSNGVPDLGAGELINVSRDVTSDFEKIKVGEVVWIPGHIGIYIGDGLVVEATSKWESKVQITACNRDIAGYNRRNWAKHGKLPYVTYVADNPNGYIVPAKIPADKFNERVKKWQQACIADGYPGKKLKIDGYWGSQCETAANKCVVKYRTLLGVQINRYQNCTKIVQTAVNVKADGHCGKQTDAAIKGYQEYVGLTPDGSAGPKTIKVILGVK